MSTQRRKRKPSNTWPNLDPEEPGPLESDGEEPPIEFLRRDVPKDQAKTSEERKRCRRPPRRKR